MIDIQLLRTEFNDRFGGNPLIVRSPGRINLIGEHIDYNDGFVLPGAIDRAIYVAVRKNDDDTIRLYAAEFNDAIETRLLQIKPSTSKSWPNYILGVVDQLIKRGLSINGFDLVIRGDVPLGAGLSSSAAVECATAYALNEIFSIALTKIELARLSQQAENDFAGVKCGIMDQFASVFGKKDHVVKLDCRSLEYEYLPARLGDYKIVLFDSLVKHSLASSAYNTRREECEVGVAMIREKYPHITSLRDASLEMIKECIRPTDKNVLKRVSYVVEEIERVERASEDLKRNDLLSFGKKMFATHEGLSREYEVSCQELDFLVDSVKSNPLVLGSRMMGGGFGGCTINIIREDAVTQVRNQITEAYFQQFGIELKTYQFSLEDGTSVP
jgi:galactokinase